MGYPTDTNWPGSVDTVEDRTDYVDIVWAADYDFQDKQIRKIQTWLGETGDLVGAGLVGEGPGGMVSPVASGGTAFRFSARNNFLGGTLVSFEDNFDVAAVQVARINYAGLLWSLGGLDISSSDFLHPPTGGALPGGLLLADAGRLFYKTGASSGLYIWDGLAWNLAGGAGAGSYIDMSSGYQYTQAPVPIEEVIGQGYFDGDLVKGALVAYFRAVVDIIFTAGVGPCTVNLYDMGPKAGPPAAPVLITTLLTVAPGGPQTLEQVLAVGPGGPAGNLIADSARMYEITVIQTSTPGDTMYVGSAGLDVR